MKWKTAGVTGEIAGALSIIFSIVCLAFQAHKRTRLTATKSHLAADSVLNSMNTAFSNDPVFRRAVWQIVDGASRVELKEAERTIMDYYMVSIATFYEQLCREVRAGILDQDALDFRGKGMFSLPYFRSSWPLYRDYLGSKFAIEFEKQNELDPSIEANW